MNLPVTTLKGLLAERSKKSQKNLNLIFNEQLFCFEDLQREANRIANALIRIGIKKGNRISLLLPNCPEFLIVMFGAASIGAPFVPINTDLTSEEIGYILNHAESSIVFTTQRYLSRISHIRGNCPHLKNVISIQKEKEEDVVEWEEFLSGVSDADPNIEVHPNEIASITYTSGTTDQPKGVILTQYTYCFAPKKRAEALGWSEKDRVIITMPLYHVNALCHMAIAMIAVGGSILLREKFSASKFWDEIREYNVTTSSLMQTIPRMLLNQPERNDDAKNPFRLAVALLPPDLHIAFEDRFALKAVGSYSLTEDILSVIGPLEKDKQKLGSCGLPVAPEVHKLTIMDENQNRCRPGELGEIVKQSPTIMKGYYKNLKATARVLKDVRLFTGDQGYVDEEGYLYFVDRKNDMIKRSGENVSSSEVERVLNSHPLITESAVIGVPDMMRQEEVKGFIVLKSQTNIEELPPKILWEFCKEHLALFKIPRYIEYRIDLPKTSSSKIQKNLLKRELATEKQKVYDLREIMEDC